MTPELLFEYILAVGGGLICLLVIFAFVASGLGFFDDKD